MSPPRPAAARFVRLAGLAVIVIAGIAVFWSRWAPAPTVVFPAEFDQLDPQLQVHLRQLIGLARREPRNPGHHATLGVAFAANGMWNEARDCFRIVRQIRPRDPLAWMYDGVATQEMGDLPAARDQYRGLVQQFPDFPQGWYRLGDVSLRLGDFEAAEASFSRLVQLTPGEWRGHAGLGEVLLRRRQPAAALPHLGRAVRLAPREKTPRFLLGQALRDSGQVEDARRELAIGQGAIHLPMPDPWSAQAHEHMKRLPDIFQMTSDYAANGQAELAAKLLEETRTYHPNNVTLRLRLAEAWAHSGRAQEARDLLTDLLDRDPGNPSTLVGLSFAYAQLNQFDEALMRADQAAKLASQEVEPLLARANALVGQGKDVEALEALRQAAAVDPQNARVQLESGDLCWRNLNRTNDALQHYRKASSLDPGFAAAFARITELSLEVKDLPAARSAFDELKQIVPDDPALPELAAALAAAATP
jgi:tetratricopeptide (TPR) repeat protein